MGRHRPAQAQAAQLTCPKKGKMAAAAGDGSIASHPPPNTRLRLLQSSYVPFLHLQPYAKIAYS